MPARSVFLIFGVIMVLASGRWLDVLCTSATRPVLLLRFILAMGVPPTGVGLAAVSAWVASVTAAAAEHEPAWAPWAAGAAELAVLCRGLQTEFPELRGDSVPHNSRVYRSLQHISRGRQGLTTKVLAGTLLLEAAMEARELEPTTVELKLSTNPSF